jgi:hypothetical protein
MPGSPERRHSRSRSRQATADEPRGRKGRPRRTGRKCFPKTEFGDTYSVLAKLSTELADEIDAQRLRFQKCPKVQIRTPISLKRLDRQQNDEVQANFRSSRTVSAIAPRAERRSASGSRSFARTAFARRVGLAACVQRPSFGLEDHIAAIDRLSKQPHEPERALFADASESGKPSRLKPRHIPAPPSKDSLRAFACVILLPGGTSWVSQTFPPIEEPLPIVTRPSTVAPA